MNRLRNYYSFYQIEGLSDRFKGEIIQRKLQVISKCLRSFTQCSLKYLDAGCAEGHYVQELALSENVCLAIGLDISLPKLLKAKNVTRKGKGLDKCQFIHASWNYLPFKDESFDVVTFFEGLEHSLNPYVPLNEIKRVLNKEGTLVISTPVSVFPLIIPELIEVFVNKFLFLITGCIFRGHLNWFTPSKLQEVLSSNFRIVCWDLNIPRHSLVKNMEVLLEAVMEKILSLLGNFFRTINKSVRKSDYMFDAILVLKPR
ncbi:MAG: methyltransferase domain-containing protein [Candidatus Bathyarchaeia archaeon]